MNKNEMLIDLMRELGRGTDLVWISPRLLNRIADTLENQENEIKGLSLIVERQADLNKKVVDLALELDTVKAERDALREASR